MVKEPQRNTRVEAFLTFGIVALIFGVASPNILGWRGSSNEDSCMASLESIARANAQYRTRFGSYATMLGDLESAGFVDRLIGSGRKSGYEFSYSPGQRTWHSRGNPNVPGTTGDRYFFVDETGVIRSSVTGPASESDPEAEWTVRNAWVTPLSRWSIVVGVLAILGAVVDIASQLLRRRSRSAAS